MSDSTDVEEIRRRKAEQLRQRLEREAAGERAGAGRSEPVHVEGPDQFDDLVADAGVVLADFYADWCGPCKMLDPIVTEIAAETDATVAKVDVDAQQALARRYGVQGVPTMVLFAAGEQVEQLVGVRGKDEIVSLIGRYA
ncbi:thioredoxin [Halobaculum litoreum]|uniref:thioredoxin n=1 Tax=Halobaculum litoreum TaxID=3031998 RepID=UPI0024C4405D|nr:thioredoxin [Halobaculum sp. DT92]